MKLIYPFALKEESLLTEADLIDLDSSDTRSFSATLSNSTESARRLTSHSSYGVSWKNKAEASIVRSL